MSEVDFKFRWRRVPEESTVQRVVSRYIEILASLSCVLPVQVLLLK